MSTELLDAPTASETTDTPVAATVAPSVSFDPATRRRLVVADEMATTLESLAEARSWDRLDPAVRMHLVAHARRLGEHVAHLGSLRPVRAVEDIALRLRRLERRLEIVVDELEPPEDARRTPGGLFLGDFTEVEPDESTPAREGERKGRPSKAKPSARESLQDGVRRFRSRAERVAAKASARALSRRLTTYILVGVVACGGAVAWNLKETFSESRRIVRAPTAGFAMNNYVKELQVFLPVISTTQRDRDIRAIVSREWLLRSDAQRRADAAGAHVWLSNRNIVGLLITWEDGTPLARFQGEQETWFDMAKPGQVVGGASGRTTP